MKHTAQAKTREQVREEFTRKGVSITEWSRQHGVKRWVVYEVLRNEKRPCVRGDSHRVAVLLGLKVGELPETSAAVNAPLFRHVAPRRAGARK